jgi:sugar/nucleoside kinase (ribokinase family)
MTEVLAVGDAIVDAVFGGVSRYPDPGEEVVAPQFDLRPGGSAGYASMGLAALGAQASVATLVGSDPLSEYWLDFVSEQGVDTGLVESVPNASVSVAATFLFESDRSFLTYRGATAADRSILPRVDDIDVDALLVTGLSQAPYLWSETFVAFVEAASDAGVPVFLDTNWSAGDWQGTADALLPAVDYLLVNDVEARRLAGVEDVESAGHTLCERGVGTCVFTAGEEGCVLVTESGVERVDAEQVEAVDLCGAGDFFNVGFVGALSEGASVRRAATVANRCAGAAVEAFELDEKLAAIEAVDR